MTTESLLIIEAVISPASPTTQSPTTSLQISLLYEDASCENNYNLGMFAYPIDCAEAAHSNPQCSGSNRIIFDDYYSVNHGSWGCRCCKDNVYQTHSVWEMYEYTEAVISDDLNPTDEPTESGAHMIVDGCPPTEGSGCVMKDNGKADECAADDVKTGSTIGNTRTDKIGLQCCEMDGSSGSRPDCISGVTYSEAHSLCAMNDMRLCSRDEVHAGIGGVKTGCGFSKYHVWTSTPCSANEDGEVEPSFVEGTAANKNVVVVDLSSFSSGNAWAASLLVLLLALAMYAVNKKCCSSKRTAYAKVQIDDMEIITDEERALNA